MRISLRGFGRLSTLLALGLTVLVAAVPLSIATGAGAAPSASIAKKKCKKGYKRVKGKCRKKSSIPAAKTVELTSAGFDGTNLHVTGRVILVKPYNNAHKKVQIKYVSSAGTTTRTVTTPGGDFINFGFSDEYAYTGPFPVEISASADGKHSNTIVVTE